MAAKTKTVLNYITEFHKGPPELVWDQFGQAARQEQVGGASVGRLGSDWKPAGKQNQNAHKRPGVRTQL